MIKTERLPLKKKRKPKVQHIYQSSVEQPMRDPWLAVNLSMFFPGIGQFYAGKLGRGLLWMIAQGLLLIYCAWSIFSPEGKVTLGLWALGLIIVLYLLNILDAHVCVYYQYPHKFLEKIPRQQKNPWFAVFASRILPGLGQLYSGKSILGLVLLSVFLVFFKLENIYGNFLIVTPALTAIATYHAFQTFPSEYKRFHLSQRSLLSIIVGLIFCWGLIGHYFPEWMEQKVDLFVIPSESMQPTLQIDDRIFVKKSPFYHPHRGDIVVFEPSENMKALDPQSGEFYIKRIIGKPLDKVQINQGIVYVNDEALQENYIAQPPKYELGPIAVPPNHYFVLGDNRNNSFDSHVWGFLPKNDIFGQAYKVYWPTGRVKSLLK